MNHHSITDTIRLRRLTLKNRSNSELNDRVRQLRKAIVKLSFEKQPDQKLHRFLMNELAKEKAKIAK